ncbi:MAG: alpha-L-rhamnosidase C-terminal domain-containing protein, partial [Chitinophagaceae bacterium]
KYLVPNTGRFDNATQGAQIFALWYNLSPDKEKTLSVLMDEFTRHKWHLSTGIFSTMMMFDIFRELEKHELAYTIANQKDFPGWGYMLANDATTLWESWAKPESSSYNHPMFGSIDEWFYKSILGINAAAPGFEKIIIKPQAPKALNWAKGNYQSVRGSIVSDWKKDGNKFLLQVTIPPNTRAEVWLQANENEKITESGKPIEEMQEMKLLRYENGYAVIAVGSGNYNFRTN